MPATNTLPYRPHNHSLCIQDALNEAKSICRRRGARLTAIREQILTLIWQSHRPLGAYDVLAMLGEKGQPAAPPTVYRALDFLQQQGLVHRIATENAFIGCSHAGHRHQGLFLICQSCGNVSELASDAVQQSIEQVAAGIGFHTEHAMLEVSGLCPACQAEAQTPESGGPSHE